MATVLIIVSVMDVEGRLSRSKSSTFFLPSLKALCRRNILALDIAQSLKASRIISNVSDADICIFLLPFPQLAASRRRPQTRFNSIM
ncbi:hypothetical protein TNCV_4160711 [Trichonephila clavipes]|nr:hypothetical protein TNCV_4160711 [Trichonephila clavipes]